jgi:hypothetical protein
MLLRYNLTGWLVYPLYNKAMLLSAWLDTNNKVWSDKQEYLNSLKVHMVTDSYRPYLDKYKHNPGLLKRKRDKTK